jgi:hypothetical protein
LIDFSGRAAIQAISPRLDQLAQQNAALRSQLDRETRQHLDERVEAIVPDYREIDSMPAWRQWLASPDPLSGVVRQQILNDAIASGSTSRCVAFFRGFQAERGGGGAGQDYGSHGRGSNTRYRSSPQGKVILAKRSSNYMRVTRKGSSRANAGRQSKPT